MTRQCSIIPPEDFVHFEQPNRFPVVTMAEGSSLVRVRGALLVMNGLKQQSQLPSLHGYGQTLPRKGFFFVVVAVLFFFQLVKLMHPVSFFPYTNKVNQVMFLPKIYVSLCTFQVLQVLWSSHVSSFISHNCIFSLVCLWREMCYITGCKPVFPFQIQVSNPLSVRKEDGRYR